MKRDSIWLPKDIYESRERLSSRCAACLLIAPEELQYVSLEPGQVSDPLLKEMLACAKRSLGKHRLMALQVVASKKITMDQVVQLLDWVNAPVTSRQFTSVRLFGWYVAELLTVEAVIEQYFAALSKVSAIARGAQKIAKNG